MNLRPFSKIHRRLLLAFALLCAASLASLFVAAGRTSASGGSPSPLERLSNLPAAPAALTAVDTRALQHFAQAGMSLRGASALASRHGRSYYRVTNTTGAACYAVGPAVPNLYRLGQIQCAADFPSAERPVLDFTVVRGSPAEPGSQRVEQSEGVVADGVGDVAFVTDSGSLVAVTPVTNNVYSVASPPNVHVTELVARDQTGAIVWSEPLSMTP
jgi:hypothetical protein